MLRDGGILGAALYDKTKDLRLVREVPTKTSHFLFFLVDRDPRNGIESIENTQAGSAPAKGAPLLVPYTGFVKI